MKDGKSEKAFSNWRPGAVHFTFPNGNWLSATWACGSYSDNHYHVWPLKDSFEVMESDRVEIMVECSEKLHKKIWKKYGEDTENSVLGYLTMQQFVEIFALLSKDSPSKEERN